VHQQNVFCLRTFKKKGRGESLSANTTISCDFYAEKYEDISDPFKILNILSIWVLLDFCINTQKCFPVSVLLTQ